MARTKLTSCLPRAKRYTLDELHASLPRLPTPPPACPPAKPRVARVGALARLGLGRRRRRTLFSLPVAPTHGELKFLRQISR